MTREQQQALSGGVDSSFEEKLKELAEIKLKIAAEEARVKAELAEAKAVEASASEPTEVQQQALSGMGLTGNRDVDGSLVTTKQIAEPEIPVAPDKDIEVSKDSHREDFKEAAKRQESERSISEEKYLDELEAVNKKFGVDETNAQEKLNAFELQDYYSHKIEVLINAQARDKTIDDKQDIDEDFWLDEESAQREMGSNEQQDRAQADWSGEEVRGEKAGWEMAEGSNMWSVDEKDDYWKTQEGYDEAVALYGKKPAWVKEPTLVWNSETQEYEEVEEEEFEDLSRPAISAEVKKLFG